MPGEKSFFKEKMGKMEKEFKAVPGIYEKIDRILSKKKEDIDEKDLKNLGKPAGEIKETFDEIVKHYEDLRDNVGYREDEEGLKARNTLHDIGSNLSSLYAFTNMLNFYIDQYAKNELDPEEFKKDLWENNRFCRARFSSFGYLFDIANDRVRKEKINLEKMADSIIYPAHKKRVTIEASGAGPLESSPAHVWRILRNYINNALEHSEEDVKIKIGKEGEKMLFEISNNGVIPEEIRNKLFKEPVTTRGEIDKSMSVGGFGLPAVKEAADRIGAELSFETGDGMTTFKVKFPLKMPRI